MIYSPAAFLGTLTSVVAGEQHQLWAIHKLELDAVNDLKSTVLSLGHHSINATPAATLTTRKMKKLGQHPARCNSATPETDIVLSWRAFTLVPIKSSPSMRGGELTLAGEMTALIAFPVNAIQVWFIIAW